ncbi:MAG: TetR/AcrR family transcriptional regulator [Solirubrobacterales bacterium]|nr:TetR/AcrR family transcriptional regulator [Solirubrobacterales bacterium]
MSDQKRTYTMKRRAEMEAATRLLITESAVELHGTLGPARTSVSAVAERAGVRRSTVYRHFPDEAALFGACSAHWMAANPPPDIGRWRAIADPAERLQVGLGEMYGYYRQGEGMLDNLLRDAPIVPVVRQLLGGYRDLLAAAAGILLAGRGVRGHARRRTAAAIGHALEFSTWRSLTDGQGLDDAKAVELMTRLAAAA